MTNAQRIQSLGCCIALGCAGCVTERVYVVPEKQYKTAQQKAAAKRTHKQLESDSAWKQIMHDLKNPR